MEYLISSRIVVEESLKKLPLETNCTDFLCPISFVYICVQKICTQSTIYLYITLETKKCTINKL